jgi:hypothetical protein
MQPKHTGLPPTIFKNNIKREKMLFFFSKRGGG